MKPTIPEVIEKFKHYLKDNPLGGCLHIVLCDGNTDDQSVMFCKRACIARGDLLGSELCDILLTMSRFQRSRIRFKAAK